MAKNGILRAFLGGFNSKILAKIWLTFGAVGWTPWTPSPGVFLRKFPALNPPLIDKLSFLSNVEGNLER